MKISANVGDTEVDFDFKVPNEPNLVWTGTSSSNESITFFEEQGIVTNLQFDSNITTPKEIIVERLMEMLKEYNDSRQMGFEVDSGHTNTVISPIPTVPENVIKPYDPELIRVRPLVLSAFQVHRDINKGKIDLNPDFQRNFVWDDTRKSRLIESMLLKIPLPAFYFAEDNLGNFQVVDGLQRLTVINQFLNNEFKLKNLEYLEDLDGKYYSVDVAKGIKKNQTLYEPYESRVETTQLNINVIEASSPLKVKYDIFFRINTGGRPLNNQEIRNCFASTKMRSLLKRMALSEKFHLATGFSISDTRMDAQELALRYLSFYFLREKYSGEMNSFLDECLEIIGEYPDSQLKDAEKRYYLALESAYHLLGDYSFRKCLPHHLVPGTRRQFINKAMFVVLTVLLAKSDAGKIKNKPEQDFALRLAQSLQDDDKLYDSLTTGTSDRSKLEYVFEILNEVLIKYIDN